jgi:DASS family divalent anion:Na+ symporter
MTSTPGWQPGGTAGESGVVSALAPDTGTAQQPVVERPPAPAGPRRGARPLPLLAVALVGLAVWLVPAPEGVEPRAWHLLAIFTATIVGIVVQPLPVSAVALIGLTVAVLTGTLTMAQTLTGFASPVVWLILAAFFIACGFVRTGLGTRIAYSFMVVLGKRSLGLAYSLIATDLVLAPGIPSNTARAGGVVFPILKSLGRAFDSEAEAGTARRISAFLTVCAYQGTVITSAMFLTAVAANPLAVGLARGIGIDITWSTWAMAASVPGILSLLLVPWILYRLYPPEIRETPAAAEIARTELTRMGPLKTSEWILLSVFVLMLVLWTVGAQRGVDTTAAALAGVALLLVTGVLTWDDVLRERDAWNTMIWFATLLMMAGQLTELGLMTWFNERIAGTFQGMSWMPTLLGLALVYFYSHYFFAGNSSHVGAMYVPFLTIALAVGAPPLLSALLLAYFSGLFAGLTHYGTAPAPILYGSGNVPLRTWWKLGGLVSVVNVAIWLIVGGIWWKAIGIW